MPAQATRTSMRPSVAAISSTARIRACRSVTSTAACATIAPWPCSVLRKLGQRGRVAIDQADRRSSSGQGRGRRMADSVGGAGDQDVGLGTHRVVFTT